MPGNRTPRVLLLDCDEATRRAVSHSLRSAGIRADISEARETEEGGDTFERERSELLARERAARREAEAAASARDEFLATLSHELRTPLNAILGWARLIAGGRLDEAAIARAASIIDRNARSEVRLIDELLELSRLAAGTLKLEARPSELVPLLESLIESAGPASRAKNILIEMDVSLAHGPIVCDSLRVRQILWNLLANALKFTPPGGRITIRATRDGDRVSIAIRDTGTGIKPEFLPLVFEGFRQQDRATTRSHGGLGIGLVVAKRLAELHGGNLTASSEGEGRGSVFTLTLPLAGTADGRSPTPRSEP